MRGQLQRWILTQRSLAQQRRAVAGCYEFRHDDPDSAPAFRTAIETPARAYLSRTTAKRPIIRVVCDGLIDIRDWGYFPYKSCYDWALVEMDDWQKAQHDAKVAADRQAQERQAQLDALKDRRDEKNTDRGTPGGPPNDKSSVPTIKLQLRGVEDGKDINSAFEEVVKRRGV
jgi:hypothetical protein